MPGVPLAVTASKGKHRGSSAFPGSRADPASIPTRLSRTFARTGLGSDAGLGNDRDDPARGVAGGPNFHDRADQPRDERSFYRQGRFLAAVLIIAATPRHLRISRREPLHADQVAVRRTVPRRPARGTDRKFRQSARKIGCLVNRIGDQSDARPQSGGLSSPKTHFMGSTPTTTFSI